MPEVILIGGAPRVGKTTLALKLLKQKPMLATSTDAIRRMLRGVLSDEQAPGLFTIHKYTSNDSIMAGYLNEHLDNVLSDQKAENVAVWRSVKDFIKSNLEDGWDVMVEGIHIIPELIQELEFDHKVVFLGNQSDNHAKIILERAKSNPSDWLHENSDEVISGWARFTKEFSKYIESEARKFNMPYIEVDDNYFDDSLNQALGQL